MEKTILITGTNGGIGQFVVKHLLEKGQRNLACHYRSKKDNLENLLRSFDLDPQKHTFQADLTNEESISEMSKAVQKNLGAVEKIVNVAGASTNSMSWKLTKIDFMKVIEDNLLTSFLCSKEFIPSMRENQFGRIINFSSIVGFTGVPGASHYCAAKAGIVGLTKALALELASKKITANAIALGYFNAGLLEEVPPEMQQEILKKIPTGRFGEKQDIGATVEFLLSDSSQFMTGQVLHLNGGQF